jgi:hypothetical protein
VFAADHGASARDRAESVCAVVLPAEGHDAPGLTIDALEHQSRAPDEVVVAGGREALRTALEGDSTWFWLLDGSVAPEPSALERLLEVLQHPDSMPAPVLLASKVLAPDGSLDRGSLPVPEVHRRDLVVAAVERRLVALRVARRGSLLVHRRGFETWGLPRARSPGYDDLAWTARLLRHEPGLLVPASVVVRVAASEQVEPGGGRMELSSRLRLIIGGALEPRQKPWFAYRLAEDALAGLPLRPRVLRRRAGAPARPAGRE